MLKLRGRSVANRTVLQLCKVAKPKLAGGGLAKSVNLFKTAGVSKRLALLNREAKLAAALCHFF